MKFWTVTYTEIIERTITSLVEADTQSEAIKKTKEFDITFTDDDCAPEHVLELKDYKAVEGDVTGFGPGDDL